MKELAVALMGAFFLAGCGSVRYPTNYVLNFPPPAPKAARTNGALGPLAIREFRCPEYLCEGRIVYRPAPEVVSFYEYHRWAADPRQTIAQYLEDGIQAQSLFESVTVHERGSEAAYVLSGNIERLEEVDQGHTIQTVCAISAQLLDTRKKVVVWSGAATETIPVKNRDVAGVVNSLSVAAQTVADRLVKSMAEEFSAAAAHTGEAKAAGTPYGDGRR